jgi:hypothetical protein
MRHAGQAVVHLICWDHETPRLPVAGPLWKISARTCVPLPKKCRPDWDITTPELKAAWQQGRKELFYPYGKTYVQTLGEQD